MKIKGITIQQLESCLDQMNKEYDYNIIWGKLPVMKGNYIHFTIRSAKSKIPGSKYSYSGRYLISASWHAHGYLFDKIYDINPNAIIYSGRMKMVNRSDNWQDYNIGSITSIL